MNKLTIGLASTAERDTIARLRHQVYACELRQHPTNPAGQLEDALDAHNLYITASQAGEVLGFISVTPPGGLGFSVEKYFARAALPFAFDASLFEVRLLTVTKPHRCREISGALMYAALRWVEDQGGTRIVAIGRRQVVAMYERVGLQPLGLTVQAGAVTYELMSETVAGIRRRLAGFDRTLSRIERDVDWQVAVPFRPHDPGCYHGGAFFEAVGVEFDRLERRTEIINADVLDAWFPPSPKVLAALHGHLDWLVRTSPPTGCEGMVSAIARARGVPTDSVLPAAGSSDLIYLVLRAWLQRASRVLLLDPTYGEYAHVLEQVIGCAVDRLPLARERNYQVDLAELQAALAGQYDLVVLVNPNSPTGQALPRESLTPVLTAAPPRTRFWIDETYIEYFGADQSQEQFAVQQPNVVVCKSMSKVYALSGVRAAYLCGAPELMSDLRRLTPPWAVGLPAQVAAVNALADPCYYAARYRETHLLRRQLERELATIVGLTVVPGVANFLLCHLPFDGPEAYQVVQRCRTRGLFLRDASPMGARLGRHALRLAIKDERTNARMLEILRSALE